MKDFRNLYLKVDAAHSAEFIAALDAVLTAGWERDQKGEQSVRLSSGTSELYHYICDKRSPREAALVAIHRRDAETLYVSTVVPRELRELDYEQYNAVLRDFNESILSRITVPFPVTFVLDSDELHIENLMSPDAYEKLRAFSAGANKATGSAHPLDRKRWFAFLIALHRDKHRLDTGSFSRWLTEVDGWSPEVAHDLAIEFEFAQGLLEHAEIG